MATTLVFGLAAAVLCASHTVSREMKNGTVLLLLSKPVHKWGFIIAKIFGITSALTIFVIICNISSLISLRVAKDQFRLDYLALYLYYGLIFFSGIIGAARNYFTKKSFSSTAILSLLVLLTIFAACLNFIPAEGKAIPLKFGIIPALCLILFAVWTMGTLTVVFATRLDVVANLTVCSVIFLSGLVSDYFLLQGSSNPILDLISKILYALLPNWQFFWMADAISSNQVIPTAYILWTGIYILLYMILCSIFAIALFQEREVAN